MGANHVEESAAQSQKLYTCEHCQMTFSRPVHLERHMRNLHSQEKESECKFCHKLFQNKHYLSVHMLAHDIDKELQCPLCKKKFTDVDALNKHKDAHLGIGSPIKDKNAATATTASYPPPPTNTTTTTTQRTAPTQQVGNHLGRSSNVVSQGIPGGRPNTANTLNFDLRLTDLKTLNKNSQASRVNQAALQNALRMRANKNSTLNCDLTQRDINSLNTNTVRFAQKRPSTDNDVIVTGVSSLKRPFRLQGFSNPATARSQQPSISAAKAPGAKAIPMSMLSQQLAARGGSQNSLLQNQLRVQNSPTRQHSINTSTPRNITDRIYLMSEGVSNRNPLRYQPPSNISHSNRKQLANQAIPNQRYSASSFYSNNNTPNQQQGQRNVVSCDLTRANLGTIGRRSGATLNNAMQQISSNGVNPSNNSTVNCDLTISNITSLNGNQRPSNNLLASRMRNQISQNNLNSNKSRSTVNFDLTTADINVLKRNRRIRQTGRVLDFGGSTVTRQVPNTLNCDLSVVNLGAMERNRLPVNTNNRFGRLNFNQNAKQNTVDLRANNLNDWNRRNAVYQRVNNQALQNSTGRPTSTLNCDLTSINLGTLNQQKTNSNGTSRVNQQVRPVQIYANTNRPLTTLNCDLTRKNITAIENNVTSIPIPNNLPGQILRNRNQQKRTLNLGSSASGLSSLNRAQLSKMIRQRRALVNNNIPVIDLSTDDDRTSTTRVRNTNSSTESNNVVQFDLTNPDINIISYDSSEANKLSSKNVVTIVDLDANNSSQRSLTSNIPSTVVEFDLANTNIRPLNTKQNNIASTCTINLNSDHWPSSNSSNSTRNKNNKERVDIQRKSNRNCIQIESSESSSSLSDITLVDIRSLNPVDTTEDKSSSVSGITLVDIRSLSTAEIEANFQVAGNETTTKTGTKKSQISKSPERCQSVPDNFSSIRKQISSLIPIISRSTDNTPNHLSTSNSIITVDLSSVDLDITEDGVKKPVGPVEVTFTCKTCSTKVCNLYNYIFHLKSHKEEGYCICYYCDSTFEDFRNLVVHSVTHVSNLKNQCVFCREVIKSNSNPIQHMTECGELQCVLFESGLQRVKVEKTDKTETATGDKSSEEKPENEDEKKEEKEKKEEVKEKEVGEEEKEVGEKENVGEEGKEVGEEEKKEEVKKTEGEEEMEEGEKEKEESEHKMEESEEEMEESEDKMEESEDKMEEGEDKMEECEDKIKMEEGEDKMDVVENKMEESEDKLGEGEDKMEEAEDKEEGTNEVKKEEGVENEEMGKKGE